MRGRNNKTYISKASIQVLWRKSGTQAVSSILENMYWLWENQSLSEGVHEQRNHAVHEVEIEIAPEPNEEDI